MIRDALRWNEWSRWGVGVVAIAIVAAVIGPFDTLDALTLGPRFGYWLGVAALVAVNWRVVSWLLRRFIGANAPWPPVAIDIVTAALVALPLVQELGWINGWVFESDGRSFAERYLWVAITAIVVCLGLHLVQTVVRARLDEEKEVRPAPEVSFLKRIPVTIEGELLCLRTEDHYLRVYTTAGDDLILHRMKDAIKELTDVDGLQVHRSYWVARCAVRGVEKKDRKITLLLKNGLNAPVSETYASKLREAGWFG